MRSPGATVLSPDLFEQGLVARFPIRHALDDRGAAECLAAILKAFGSQWASVDPEAGGYRVVNEAASWDFYPIDLVTRTLGMTLYTDTATIPVFVGLQA